MEEIVRLRILRGVMGQQYFEEFAIASTSTMTVVEALRQIQRHPVTVEGKKVCPVVWEQGCVQGSCGVCAMLINGMPKQACTTRLCAVQKQTGSRCITLAPLTKFPLLRDLVVDKTKISSLLQQVEAWVEVERLQEASRPEKIAPAQQIRRQTLASCMVCGCCMEACPQYHAHTAFMGPAVLAQVHLRVSDPAEKHLRAERLRKVMGEEGVISCSQVQNCVQVCPQQIPLAESIATLRKQVSKQAWQDFFGLEDG